MATYRTLVSMPPDVVEEIDKAVGVRNRSKFLTDVARRELKRQEQMSALGEAAGTWLDKDHPELAKGAAAHVSQMRKEGNARFADLLSRNTK
ncbi:MAG: ribbon-helix-helix domain-containing protein [Bryobacteraceae bacterium]